MKRFICMLLTGLLLLGICCGCETSTPQSVVVKGQPYTVSEGNYITVIEAFVEDNSIVVKLSVDFTSAAFKDLKGITVRKLEVEQPYIPYNMEQSAMRNDGKDVLVQTIEGSREIYLAFTDSRINAETDLSGYVLSVPVGYDGDGNIVLNDAMALG